MNCTANSAISFTFGEVSHLIKDELEHQVRRENVAGSSLITSE